MDNELKQILDNWKADNIHELKFYSERIREVWLSDDRQKGYDFRQAGEYVISHLNSI